MHEHRSLTEGEKKIIEEMLKKGLLQHLGKSDYAFPQKLGLVMCPGPNRVMGVMGMLLGLSHLQIATPNMEIFPVIEFGGAGNLVPTAKISLGQTAKEKMEERIDEIVGFGFKDLLITGEVPCLQGDKTQTTLEQNINFIIGATMFLRTKYIKTCAATSFTPGLIVPADNFFGVDILKINA
ncbi:MAG: hypothetical protein WCX97_01185 [Candidatus Magasanikbacteria bacterium]